MKMPKRKSKTTLVKIGMSFMSFDFDKRLSVTIATAINRKQMYIL